MVAKQEMFPRVSNVLPGGMFEGNESTVAPVY